MGFSFRKSIKIGPVRLNVSKSGVGVSAGVKGARIGVNSKGKVYGSASAMGLTYRTQLYPTAKRKDLADEKFQNVVEAKEIPMASEKENGQGGVNVGAVVGVLIIVFSFVVMPFHLDAGLVGVLVGLAVMIVFGIFAVAKKNTLGWLRTQIVQNARLSDAEVEYFVADYCERKKLSVEDTARTMADFLRERENFQKIQELKKLKNK